MRLFLALVAFVIIGVSGCASPPPSEVSAIVRRNLGQEQWDACSHFPSVELVEISDDGTLFVREKNMSGLPVEYQRCVSAVEYSQFKRGDREPFELIKAGYFTAESPSGVVYSGGLGKFPRTGVEFDLRSRLRFLYIMRFTGARFDTRVEWYSPTGQRVWKETRENNHRGKTVHSSYYYFSTLPQGSIRERGEWRVKLFLDDVSAGNYSVVLK